MGKAILFYSLAIATIVGVALIFSPLLSLSLKMAKNVWEKKGEDNVELETGDNGHVNDLDTYGNSTIYFREIDKESYIPYVLKENEFWYPLRAKENGRTIVTSKEKARRLAAQYQADNGQEVVF